MKIICSRYTSAQRKKRRRWDASKNGNASILKEENGKSD